MNELAITVIGHDRPGIVADVADALAGLGANLTDSTMTRLRGHFAMTLVCSGPGAAEVETALAPLADDGRLLASVLSVVADHEEPPRGEPHQVAVYGADRLGIVAAVTRVLASAGANVTDLTTRLAGQLYVLVAEVDLPAGIAEDLQRRLAEVGRQLDVEVTLRRVDPDVL
ncbi:glycine cleavage system protein R [Plantactinospora sp. KBS50]|uniref:glycine cleavage system protein R n=1 Tax=Plantactinospora sp. KBS50 TaxID=2024580 RepID=UPI000BAAC02B|nr:ACT domain-containing protein [Plantactinospora sp. KBS50]ASW57005.1 amino acid-binding protein [Plantactinospora sp. KBS50]